jgi:hypothetical protein
MYPVAVVTNRVIHVLDKITAERNIDKLSASANSQ